MSAAKRQRRAAIYCRISFDPSGLGQGVKNQEPTCRAHIKRSAMQLVDVFVDNDVSAMSGKRRPEYLRLVAAIEAGTVDVIVCWRIDRLYRKPKELEQLIDLVERFPIRIATVEGAVFDLNTAAGRATARMLVTMASMESEMKGERHRLKHAQLAADGASPGGHRPFGWADDRRSLHPVESEQLRDAVRRILSGETISAVCRDWNKNGAATPRRATFWRSGSLRRVLLSPRLKGVRTLSGIETATGDWEPIIDAETFARLQSALRFSTTPGHSVARKHLLPGFLYCSKCGTTLRTQPSERTGLRYGCRPCDGGCGKVSIKAEPVERLVVDAIFERADAQRVARLRKDGKGAREGAAISAIEASRAQLDEIARQWGAREIDTRERDIARTAARAALESAEREYASLTTDVIAATLMTADLRAKWDGFTLDQKRTIIAAQLERIEIMPAAKGGRFSHERVCITPR